MVALMVFLAVVLVVSVAIFRMPAVREWVEGTLPTPVDPTVATPPTWAEVSTEVTSAVSLLARHTLAPDPLVDASVTPAEFERWLETFTNTVFLGDAKVHNGHEPAVHFKYDAASKRVSLM